MGRGRAKAKQTKLARELKYRTVSTDLTSLERELREREAGGDPFATSYEDVAAQYDDLPVDEQYAEYADYDEDDEDDEAEQA